MSFGGFGNSDNNNPLYGGGGSSGSNYYDRTADFSSDRPSGQGYGVQGGAEYNRPAYGGGNRRDDDDSDDDMDEAVHSAERNHSDQDSSLFSTAISFLKNNKSDFKQNNDVDEGRMVQAHQALYGGRDDGQQDSSSLGAGAAMQALKMFTSGSGAQGGSKNELIGLAMAQAGKLWEEKQSAGNVSGDKQSAINAAAEMALKMYLKSKVQGGGPTAGTGGPSGLMGLASKFLS